MFEERQFSRLKYDNRADVTNRAAGLQIIMIGLLKKIILLFNHITFKELLKFIKSSVSGFEHKNQVMTNLQEIYFIIFMN